MFIKASRACLKLAVLTLLVSLGTADFVAAATIESNDTNESEQTLTCDPTVNLIENGSFESPLIVSEQGWDVYTSAVLGFDWNVDWVHTGIGEPEVANVELHRDGWWSSNEGLQWAELDSDWSGPGVDDGDNEMPSISIYQTIETIPGATYQLTYAFSARPGTNEATNGVEVHWDNQLLSEFSADGSTATDTQWQEYTQSVIAADESAVVMFSDTGVSDAEGSFLDAVSLTCVSLEDTETDEPKKSSSGGSRKTKLNIQHPEADGLVLGANACSIYLFDYLRLGDENRVFEVQKLQAFLIGQGYDVAITSVFDEKTDRAVRAFQLAHSQEVLMPWVEAGFMASPYATGYVYKTTRWMINEIVCPGIEAFPDTTNG